MAYELNEKIFGGGIPNRSILSEEEWGQLIDAILQEQCILLLGPCLAYTMEGEIKKSLFASLTEKIFDDILLKHGDGDKPVKNTENETAEVLNLSYSGNVIIYYRMI